MLLLKKIKTKLYQKILQYLSNSFQNFLIEHKLKEHNFLLFRLLSKVIKTGFFLQSKKYHCRLLLWYEIREIHGTKNE